MSNILITTLQINIKYVSPESAFYEYIEQMYRKSRSRYVFQFCAFCRVYVDYIGVISVCLKINV